MSFNSYFIYLELAECMCMWIICTHLVISLACSQKLYSWANKLWNPPYLTNIVIHVIVRLINWMLLCLSSLIFTGLIAAAVHLSKTGFCLRKSDTNTSQLKLCIISCLILLWGEKRYNKCQNGEYWMKLKYTAVIWKGLCLHKIDRWCHKDTAREKWQCLEE